MRSSAPVSPEFAAAFRALAEAERDAQNGDGRNRDVRNGDDRDARNLDFRNGDAASGARFRESDETSGSTSANALGTVTATLTFAQFMELAMYHPQLGYYRRDRKRVGYGEGTDFYTASSSGAVFGELVVAACVKLLGVSSGGSEGGAGISDESASALPLRSKRSDGSDKVVAAKDYTFVEIGAETDGGVLAGVAHPFAAAKTVRVGEDFTSALSGRCVVFSNELFDAQPIRRFIRRDSAWRECGVELNASGELAEVELAVDIAETTKWLPNTFASHSSDEGGNELPDGYRFDAPRAASDLAAKIAAQPWEGLFVAFDYGKSLAELTSMTPNGTARAYFKHTQSNDLLANAGKQDLTAHVCWDWLAEALSANGFNQPTIESQEAFFIGHAGEFLAKTMADEASRLSQRKLALLQLLHPTHLGQKFQVLWARR